MPPLRDVIIFYPISVKHEAADATLNNVFGSAQSNSKYNMAGPEAILLMLSFVLFKHLQLEKGTDCFSGGLTLSLVSQVTLLVPGIEDPEYTPCSSLFQLRRKAWPQL